MKQHYYAIMMHVGRYFISPSSQVKNVFICLLCIEQIPSNCMLEISLCYPKVRYLVLDHSLELSKFIKSEMGKVWKHGFCWKNYTFLVCSFCDIDNTVQVDITQLLIEYFSSFGT